MHGLCNKFQDCCPCWQSRHLNHRRVTNLFLMYYFLLDEGPTLETLDFTIRIANLFIFRLQVKYFLSLRCEANYGHFPNLIQFNANETMVSRRGWQWDRNVFSVKGTGGSRFAQPIPAKARQFLSYKHSVPLCPDDIMLALKIVPGEIVLGRNILM